MAMARGRQPRSGGARRAHAGTLAAGALCIAACADPAHIRLLQPAAEPHADAAPAEPDASDAAPPDAAAPDGQLVLRYDFAGTGTRVADRVGDADAVVLGGAALDGMGGLTLDGADDYVDMPNGILSQHESATIVVWIEWHGDPDRNAWERIFDFGVSDAGEDMVGNAVTSLFMTPSSLPRNVLMVMAEFGGTQQALVASSSLPRDRRMQVALSVDGARSAVTMYVEGRAVAQGTLSFRLRDIDDVNNWLGRSQWVQDLHLGGRYDEVRIYDGVLPAAEIADLQARGPNEL